jgi:hypothetical protein
MDDGLKGKVPAIVEEYSMCLRFAGRSFILCGNLRVCWWLRMSVINNLAEL